MELRAKDPAAHRIIWHDLKPERHAIEKAIPDCATIYGNQDLEEREALIGDFADGRVQESRSTAATNGRLGLGPPPAAGRERWKLCSWTFDGIANASAEVWAAMPPKPRMPQHEPAPRS